MSSVIPPSSQPKVPKNRGSDLGGKRICLVEAMAPTLEGEVNEHEDESDSNNCDCHWKRPLKRANISVDDLGGRGSSAVGVIDVPLLVCTFSILTFLIFFSSSS